MGCKLLYFSISWCSKTGQNPGKIHDHRQSHPPAGDCFRLGDRRPGGPQHGAEAALQAGYTDDEREAGDIAEPAFCPPYQERHCRRDPFPFRSRRGGCFHDPYERLRKRSVRVGTHHRHPGNPQPRDRADTKPLCCHHRVHQLKSCWGCSTRQPKRRCLTGSMRRGGVAGAAPLRTGWGFWLVCLKYAQRTSTSVSGSPPRPVGYAALARSTARLRRQPTAPIRSTVEVGAEGSVGCPTKSHTPKPIKQQPIRKKRAQAIAADRSSGPLQGPTR